MILKGEITMLSRGRDEGRLGRTREFIEIGGRRVRHIGCSDYIESFLQPNTGEFELSTFKRKKYEVIVAVRRPDGELVEDTEMANILSREYWFAGPFVGFILGIVLGLMTQSFAVFLLVLAGIGVIYPAAGISSLGKARKALG